MANLQSAAIVQVVKPQNIWCNNSVVFILKGVQDIDIMMNTKRGEEGEQRTMRQFLKEKFIPDNYNTDFLFKQVELATCNRVYLVHKKVHNNAVKTFSVAKDA